jgi:hypothetical protein
VGQHSPDDHRVALARSFVSTGMRVEELWLAYFALGGSAGRYEVEAYLAGLMPMTAHEHNVLAQAVNERLAELAPPPRAPYRLPDQESAGVEEDSAAAETGGAPPESAQQSQEHQPRQSE